MPLTNSLYVPGKLSDVENVIVDVGTGYYVKKVCFLTICSFRPLSKMCYRVVKTQLSIIKAKLTMFVRI